MSIQKREIKFRFWLGHTKKMTYEHSLIEISHAAWDFTEDIIPLQYTGLKDKNGKEIYEGDIMDYGNGRVFYISYVGVQFMATFNDRVVNSIIPIHNFSIIGNIYENPELLKPNPSSLLGMGRKNKNYFMSKKIETLSQQEENSALREVRKLLNVLQTYGNVLVPSLDNKETFATDRLTHFVDKLQAAGMTMDVISQKINDL